MFSIHVNIKGWCLTAVLKPSVKHVKDDHFCDFICCLAQENYVLHKIMTNKHTDVRLKPTIRLEEWTLVINA